MSTVTAYDPHTDNFESVEVEFGSGDYKYVVGHLLEDRRLLCVLRRSATDEWYIEYTLASDELRDLFVALGNALGARYGLD